MGEVRKFPIFMARREGRNRLSEEVKVMEGLGYLCESKGLCIDSKLGCGECWKVLKTITGLNHGC